jgi:hypothetical protein
VLYAVTLRPSVTSLHKFRQARLRLLRLNSYSFSKENATAFINHSLHLCLRSNLSNWGTSGLGYLWTCLQMTCETNTHQDEDGEKMSLTSRTGKCIHIYENSICKYIYIYTTGENFGPQDCLLKLTRCPFFLSIILNLKVLN